MSFGPLNCCRLCTTTEASLVNLYKMNGTIGLHDKINWIMDLKIYPEDGLPSLICKLCHEMIESMYNFKQKCIEVDLKLRSLNNCLLPSTLDDLCNIEKTIEQDCTSTNELMCYQGTFMTRLSETPGKDEKDEYSNSEIYMKTETTHFSIESLDGVLSEKHKKTQRNIKSYKTKARAKSPNEFMCDHCGCILKKKTILEKHINSHFGIKLFSCKFCPKRFTRKAHKVAHMRSHLGIRPFICEICGNSFVKRQDLIRHLKIHSDEKKYACPRCDRRFKRSSDVHSHMRTHTGVKPYECSVCGKKYASHSSLQKHYKAYCKKEQSIQNAKAIKKITADIHQ